MTAVRCDGFYLDRFGNRHKCNRLLCYAEPGSVIEVKCPSCKKLVRWPVDKAPEKKN